MPFQVVFEARVPPVGFAHYLLVPVPSVAQAIAFLRRSSLEWKRPAIQTPQTQLPLGAAQWFEHFTSGNSPEFTLSSHDYDATFDTRTGLLQVAFL